jgi:hypothetical protein
VDLTLFLDYFPEFGNANISDPQFAGLLLLASKFLCFVPIASDDPAYAYFQGLVLAHILSLSLNGGNPVQKVDSLESSMTFRIPTSAVAFTSFGQTMYGRLIEDFVNLSYGGGFSWSFLAVPYVGEC